MEVLSPVATPERCGRVAVRVSPYPQRTPILVRGVEHAAEALSDDGLEADEAEDQAHVPLSPRPTTELDGVAGDVREVVQTTQSPDEPAAEALFQLIVRPIVKRTLGQRDASGDVLADTIFSGRSFQAILRQLWTAYAPRIRGRAVRTDGVWSVEDAVIEEWTRLMQFKTMRHLVESTKTDTAWAQWLQRVRGQTVKLMIYEYGLAISRAQDYEEFQAAVIRPEQVDRAGALAEIPFQDLVARLQEQWGATFRAEAVVWRMWANHITRNLNRSTWEVMLTEDPPEYVASLLRAPDSRLEHQVTNMRRSAHLALDAVQGAMADYRQFRLDWDALGRRLEAHERNLQTRQSILDAFLRDSLPPALSEVPDPTVQLTNVADTEHED